MKKLILTLAITIVATLTYAQEIKATKAVSNEPVKAEPAQINSTNTTTNSIEKSDAKPAENRVEMKPSKTAQPTQPVKPPVGVEPVQPTAPTTAPATKTKKSNSLDQTPKN